MMCVAFGMARYAFGLTLPAIRSELEVPEVVLGLIGSGSFGGFLFALLAAPPVARWKGPRAPITIGGVSATVGCVLVTVAPVPSVLALGALIAGSAAGWVWASYSTIVAAVAAPRHRPRLLARITTGAAAGLVVVGVLALVVDSWRATWAGIALLAAAATALNLRCVPRLPPARRPPGPDQRSPGTGLAAPAGFAVVLFIGTTAYFTYAADAAAPGVLGRAAGPAIFAVVGVAGLTGVAAGAVADRAGGRTVAVIALLLLGVALALLGICAGSPPALLVSAVFLGAANTVGSAALAIWTAAVNPDDPAAAFTFALIVGSVSAAMTPAAIGAVAPLSGLRPALLGAAGLATGSAAALLSNRRPGRREPGHTHRQRL